MARLRLAPRAREILQAVARSSAPAREVRRAQALLWLADGETVESIAVRLGVSRQTIYNWAQRYEARHTQPVHQRVQDRPHTGRRPRLLQKTMQQVDRLLARSPRRYGYRGQLWTVPMLRTQVARRLREAISERTVRRALEALRQSYKRPRYVLSRRSPTWRQAKGG